MGYFKIVLLLAAAPVFLLAMLAHIYVKIKMRPPADSDFDEYYHEFEDAHPRFAVYEKWSKITFAAAVAAALLLFLAVAL